MPALLRLLRPANLVLTLVVVGLGGVLAIGPAALGPSRIGPLLLAMAAAALVGSAANALNDVYDADIDRLNRPDRPVSSGAVAPGVARAVWAGLSAVGVLLAALASATLAAIAAASVAVLWLYNAHLKGTPGPGNVVVAAVIATAPLYGALAVGSTPAAVWAAVGLTFLVTLAREIAKDVEDAVGDAVGGARTLAVTFGEGTAARLSAAVVWVTVAAMPVPIVWGVGRAFLAYGLGAAACLLTAAWLLMVGAGEGADRARRAAGRARAWLKGAMIAGVAALLLARLG